MTVRHSAESLRQFAHALLTRVGLEADKASSVADILVEGDLLGHTTHGLALLPQYLGEVEKGGMTKSGSPVVVADFPSVVTWDGKRMPGPWLVLKAIELA